MNDRCLPGNLGGMEHLDSGPDDGGGMSFTEAEATMEARLNVFI